MTKGKHKQNESNDHDTRESCYDKDEPPIFVHFLFFDFLIHEDLVSWFLGKVRSTMLYCCHWERVASVVSFLVIACSWIHVGNIQGGRRVIYFSAGWLRIC